MNFVDNEETYKEEVNVNGPIFSLAVKAKRSKKKSYKTVPTVVVFIKIISQSLPNLSHLFH